MTLYCHLIITIVILSQKYRTLKANMSLSSKAYLVYTNLERAVTAAVEEHLMHICVPGAEEKGIIGI